jgi:putative Ca2+/H+ antiporter (TMEM165/GDT1 family)
MTAKTGSPLSVFLGASLALALVTLLGVLAGKAVTRIVPLHWVSRGAALLFIVIGLVTLAGIS